MDMQPLEILKWVGIALAAGFIGYFGRYLAMRIIEKLHRRKSQPPPAAAPHKETAVSPESLLARKALKVEKKKAKLAVKKAKKGQKR